MFESFTSVSVFFLLLFPLSFTSAALAQTDPYAAKFKLTTWTVKIPKSFFQKLKCKKLVVKKMENACRMRFLGKEK